MDLNKLKNNILKKGADDVILTSVNSNVNRIKFVNNKIVKTGTHNLNALNIFVAKDKKLVSTSVKDISEKVIAKTLQELFSFIKKTKPSQTYKGIAEGPFKYEQIPDTYDKQILNIDGVDYVEAGINAALENAERASGIFESETSELTLVSSNNVEASEKASSLNFSIRSFASKEASGQGTCSSRILKNFNTEKEGRTSGEIAKKALNPELGPNGKFDVIFDFQAISNLLAYVADAASIFNVEAGLSFLADKSNTSLGSFTLIDDATLPNGFNSTPFDEEGSPTKRNIIVDKGILKTYLHNASTAKRYKVPNTSNSGIISPHPWNIILEGKQGNVFDIKKGLYITNVWYTRFQNYSEGTFSTIPRDGAFIIENGAIKKSIKNIRISDNILNILKNIYMVSKEKEQTRTWDSPMPIITPKVLVREVNITKPVI